MLNTSKTWPVNTLCNSNMHYKISNPRTQERKLKNKTIPKKSPKSATSLSKTTLWTSMTTSISPRSPKWSKCIWIYYIRVSASCQSTKLKEFSMIIREPRTKSKERKKNAFAFRCSSKSQEADKPRTSASSSKTASRNMNHVFIVIKLTCMMAAILATAIMN